MLDNYFKKALTILLLYIVYSIIPKIAGGFINSHKQSYEG